MAYTRIGGGFWLPSLPPNWGTTSFGLADSGLLDADEEEVQMIGRVSLAAGSGSKTFGTSGSSIQWLPGASITFSTGSTLRVGIKKSTTFDDANGPAGRATIGAAAFDVYDDLTGGTDTITATTWREDAMSAGTPFSVAHGDRVAVCFHLDTTSGTPSVKVRMASSTGSQTQNFPTITLVTSGPTYTALGLLPNVIIKFDDGTLGWIDPCQIATATGSEAIGNTNLYGNIIELPFDCKVDALGILITPAGTTNFDIGFYSTPLGTPAAITNGTVSVDPQNMGTAAQRFLGLPLPAEITLSKNTEYALAVQQNSATGLTIFHYDVAAAAHMQPNGLDSAVYAAKSTAGAAFAAQNSSLRRALMFARVSQIDDGTGSGGGLLMPNLRGNRQL